MNIIFDGTKASQAYADIDRELPPQAASRSAGTAAGGFAVDFSGSALNNNAYAEHGKSMEEVMQEVGQENLTAQRNYMAVMSNSMSDEDFAKLQEEGFHPGSTDIETVVTIVDEIKAALIKGGTHIEGYTDNISDEVLESITGSEAFANELKKQFARRDIPLTEENAAAVTEAYQILSQAGVPNDGSIKYMVENGMEPTPENFYTAKYSAHGNGSPQGKGYYAAGNGYYAKKPEEVDFDSLRPQLEKVVEEAGFQVNEENLQDAKWLGEMGVPLNRETFSILNQVRQQHYPVTFEDFLTAAACAVADGVSPAKAVIGRKETYTEQASALVEKTASIRELAADIIMARDIPLTLRNLLAVHDELIHGHVKLEAETDIMVNLRGRRLLEEVRLSMTVEANLKLLRSGFQIETAPLEELVAKLKEAEENYAKSMTGQVDAGQAKEKISLYQETLSIVRKIQFSPAAIVAKISEKETLRDVCDYGQSRSLAYEKAGESYETLMTSPRQEMGDSIQKAFRNIDDILKDMGLDVSDANRRACRILGYNNIEITQENIRQVREKDELLLGVVEQMKPGKVLHMIREGVNPLTMSLEELGDYLGRQEDTAQEMESYSRFLYKLEKQKDITEEERSAYIGIYRLVHQIEKGDDAAVGALWQTGAEFTLGNLLSAVRTGRRGSMNYTVDDSFGGVNARKTGKETISGQIAKGYQALSMPDRQELEQILQEAGDEEAEKEFDHMVNEQVRNAVKSEREVLRHLSDYSAPVTADNLLAAESLLKNPKEIWKKIEKLGEQEEPQETGSEDVETSLTEAGKEVFEALEGREGAQKAYEGMQEGIRKIIEKMAFSHSYGAMDVKAMSTLYKQVKFMGNMAREENYEIPANIGGSLTSINLKIIHKGQKESKVAVAFDTDIFGKTGAEFQITNKGLTGFCICSTREGTGLLKEKSALLKDKLSRAQIQPGELYFLTSETLNLADFSLKESNGRQPGDDSRLLYKAAKAFIEYVQDTAQRKEI